jgi:hypothetical protein
MPIKYEFQGTLHPTARRQALAIADAWIGDNAFPVDVTDAELAAEAIEALGLDAEIVVGHREDEDGRLVDRTETWLDYHEQSAAQLAAAFATLRVVGDDE